MGKGRRTRGAMPSNVYPYAVQNAQKINHIARTQVVALHIARRTET